MDCERNYWINVIRFIAYSIIRFLSIELFISVIYLIVPLDWYFALCDKLFDNLPQSVLDIKISCFVYGGIMLYLLMVTIVIGCYCIYEHDYRQYDYVVTFKNKIYILLAALALYYYHILEHKSHIIAFGLSCLLLYIVIELYEYKVIGTYSYGEVLDNIFLDKPVHGREYLMKNQIVCLDELEQYLDMSELEDSFSIAFISKWGTGKTSVIDTLIEEESNCLYLKMSAASLVDIDNIVRYVDAFLEKIFIKYGVYVFSGHTVKNFFSLLEDYIGNAPIRSFASRLSSDINSNNYRDLERERIIIEKKICDVLKKSGKRHLVLIVDDADRSEIEKKIIMLLGYFASIKGIVSIILLSEDNISSKVDMEGWSDKYIQTRVIMENSDAENEVSIMRQIERVFQKQKKIDNCAIIHSANTSKVEIMKPVEDFSTMVFRDNKMPLYNKYNILSELFLYNCIKSKNTIGKYIGELLVSYFMNSKDAEPLLAYLVNSTENNIQDSYSSSIQSSWFCNEQFDENNQIEKVKRSVERVFYWLSVLYEVSKTISDENDDVKKGLKHITDLIILANSRNKDLSIITIQSPDSDKIQIVEMHDIEVMFFNDGKVEDILERGDYDELTTLLKELLDGWSNFVVFSAIIFDFVKYLNLEMSNYRQFKYNLRKVELLGINYLDFVISNYQKQIDNQKVFSVLKERYYGGNPQSEIQIPFLRSCFNQMLYYNYVQNTLRYRTDKVQQNMRLELFRGKENTILLVRYSYENEMILLNSCGEKINDLADYLTDEEIIILQNSKADFEK